MSCTTGLSPIVSVKAVMHINHGKLILIAAFLSTLLSGCVSSHTVYFMGRKSAATASTTVSGTPGQNGGPINVTLKGRTYSGRWVYVQSGGAIGFGTATASSGASNATASGTMFSAPTQGGGSILASAPDGSSLHCAFNYNEWSKTGVGTCDDSHGETYDLQIN